MSPTKIEVIATAKINGGAYRVVETPEGDWRVERWTAEGWRPGGASLRYKILRGFTPVVSAAFAKRLGIPLEDVGLMPKKPMMERDDITLDAALRGFEELMRELKRIPCHGVLDGDALLSAPGEAWVFDTWIKPARWRETESAAASMDGHILTKAAFDAKFPNLPPLPATAFQRHSPPLAPTV